jgi:hypothetical protein
MIYAGRIQNQQYSQYANRAAGYKPDFMIFFVYQMDEHLLMGGPLFEMRPTE